MDNKKDIIQYRTDKRPNNMGLQNAGNNTDSHDKNSPTPATTGKEIENTDSRGDVNSKEIIQYDFSVFLNRKTEKLTTALYMVTSFLSDTEPLKWKLRGCGIDLLSDMTTVRNSSVSEVENIFADYSLAIEEMVSLLEVGVSAKLISEMNFAILKKEYISLKVLIESDKYTENRIGRFVFPQSFFLGDESLIAEANIEGDYMQVTSQVAPAMSVARLTIKDISEITDKILNLVCPLGQRQTEIMLPPQNLSHLAKRRNQGPCET